MVFQKGNQLRKGKKPWNIGKGEYLSKEIRDKITKANIGKIAWNKGIPRTNEERKNISISLIGIKSFRKGLTYEQEYGKEKAEILREKNRIGHLKQNLGGHHSEETKLKISNSNKGKIMSEEAKRKMSETKKRLYIERKLPLFIGATNENNPAKRIEVRKKMSNTKIERGIAKLEKNPAWLGGLSFEPYTLEFNKYFKNKIRNRDNQICMLCSIHREKLSRALHIHHINYDKTLSIPQNCISLCNSCHVKTNLNRTHWTKFFQSLLSERYGYKYTLNNEIELEVI